MKFFQRWKYCELRAEIWSKGWIYFNVSIQKRLALAKIILFPFELVRVPTVHKFFRDPLYINQILHMQMRFSILIILKSRKKKKAQPHGYKLKDSLGFFSIIFWPYFFFFGNKNNRNMYI